MTDIEQRLKEILHNKGITLTDVATKIGTSPSNLLSSIKGNPTISRLRSIADAINISVSDLIADRPEPAQGVTIINGQVYQLSRPSQNTVQLPFYHRYDKLHQDVISFVKKAVQSNNPLALMGMIDATEVFSLIYDGEGAKFFLSVCYSRGYATAYAYDKLAYAKWDNIKEYRNPSWNLEDIIEDIISDLECTSPIAQLRKL